MFLSRLSGRDASAWGERSRDDTPAGWRRAGCRRWCARLDAHIAKAAPFMQPILAHIRQLVDKTLPDVEEAIKWPMLFSTETPGN
jgi:hypothetical protein